MQGGLVATGQKEKAEESRRKTYRKTDFKANDD